MCLGTVIWAITNNNKQKDTVHSTVVDHHPLSVFLVPSVIFIQSCLSSLWSNWVSTSVQLSLSTYQRRIKRSFSSESFMAAISLSSSKIPSLNSKESSSVYAFTSRSISAVKIQFPVRRVRTEDLKFPSLSSTTRCTPRPVISFSA